MKKPFPFAFTVDFFVLMMQYRRMFSSFICKTNQIVEFDIKITSLYFFLGSW